MNPTFGVKKPAYGKKSGASRRTNTRPSALRSPTWKAKAALARSAILRFTALTGCRIGEAENLQWSEDRSRRFTAHLQRHEDRQVDPPTRRAGEGAAGGRARSSDNPFVFPALRLDALPCAGIKRFYRGLFKAAGLAFIIFKEYAITARWRPKHETRLAVGGHQLDVTR